MIIEFCLDSKNDIYINELTQNKLNVLVVLKKVQDEVYWDLVQYKREKTQNTNSIKTIILSDKSGYSKQKSVRNIKLYEDWI